MGHLTLGELLGHPERAISSQAVKRLTEGSTTNGSNLTEKKPTRAPNTLLTGEDIVCSLQECKEVGIKSPTLGLGHVTTKQQRFQDSESAAGGFTSLMFNGKPILVDAKCPAGYLYALNENYLDLYIHSEENFRFEAFAKPVNQNVKIGHIFAQLALTSSNNRFHGAMTALV